MYYLKTELLQHRTTLCIFDLFGIYNFFLNLNNLTFNHGYY